MNSTLGCKILHLLNVSVLLTVLTSTQLYVCTGFLVLWVELLQGVGVALSKYSPFV